MKIYISKLKIQKYSTEIMDRLSNQTHIKTWKLNVLKKNKFFFILLLKKIKELSVKFDAGGIPKLCCFPM